MLGIFTMGTTEMMNCTQHFAIVVGVEAAALMIMTLLIVVLIMAAFVVIINCWW